MVCEGSGFCGLRLILKTPRLKSRAAPRRSPRIAAAPMAMPATRAAEIGCEVLDVGSEDDKAGVVAETDNRVDVAALAVAEPVPDAGDKVDADCPVPAVIGVDIAVAPATVLDGAAVVYDDVSIVGVAEAGVKSERSFSWNPTFTTRAHMPKGPVTVVEVVFDPRKEFVPRRPGTYVTEPLG